MEEVSFLNTGKDQHIKTFNWLFMFDKTEYSSNQANPSFLFENAGTYSVALIVTNDYQCKDTLIKTITVASDFAVYVHNTFSPNQDNKNETLFRKRRLILFSKTHLHSGAFTNFWVYYSNFTFVIFLNYSFG